MKQVQQLQARLAQAQQRLSEVRVEASAGGEAVTVVMNAKPEVESVRINPEAVDAGEVEMLQDLITAATNEALGKIRSAQTELMGGLTGGLDLPGLPSM